MSFSFRFLNSTLGYLDPFLIRHVLLVRALPARRTMLSRRRTKRHSLAWTRPTDGTAMAPLCARHTGRHEAWHATRHSARKWWHSIWWPTTHRTRKREWRHAIWWRKVCWRTIHGKRGHSVWRRPAGREVEWRRHEIGTRTSRRSSRPGHGAGRRSCHGVRFALGGIAGRDAIDD